MRVVERTEQQTEQGIAVNVSANTVYVFDDFQDVGQTLRSDIGYSRNLMEERFDQLETDIAILFVLIIVVFIMLLLSKRKS